MTSSLSFGSSFSTVSTVTLCDGEFDEDTQTFADIPVMFPSSFSFSTASDDEVVIAKIEDLWYDCSSISIENESIGDDTRKFTLKEQRQQSILNPHHQDYHISEKRDYTPRLPKRRESIESLTSLEASETTMISVVPNSNNNSTSVQQEQEQKLGLNYTVSSTSIRILCRNKPFRSMRQYSRRNKTTTMDSE